MLFYLVYNSSRDSNRQNLPDFREGSFYRVQYRDPFEKDFEIFLATISKETDDFRMAIKAWNEYVEEKLKERDEEVVD